MRVKQAVLTAMLVAATTAPVFAVEADMTGTGGGPATAAKAPYTTSTGSTVPRPGTIDGQEAGTIDHPTQQDKVDNSITQGICIGCAPK